MDSFDVYIYQHVPKCGGRSFIEVCRKHLHKVADSPPPFPTKQQRAEFQKTKKDLSTLPTRTFLHGHLIHRGIRAFERYGKEMKEGKCAVLTIIRDPLERALSEYFHRKKRGLDSGTVREWLAQHSNNICGNLGIRMKGAKPVEDFFLMIGTTERLQDSVNVFAHLAGFPTEEIGRVNASPREVLDVTEKDLEAFRNANSEDYALYAYAQEKLDRQVSELPKQGVVPVRAQTVPSVTYPVLIYQELSKCAGRPFLKACKRHFEMAEDAGELPPDRKPNLSELRKPALVRGSLAQDGARSSERYRAELDQGLAGIFTIVRDPLERSVAMFLERLERGKLAAGDLQDWLGRRKNGMSKRLGVKVRDGKLVGEPYLFIGVFEQMEQTFAALLKFAGIEAEPGRDFKTPGSVLSKVELKPEWVETFRQENAKDFALYDFAKRKLEELK